MRQTRFFVIVSLLVSLLTTGTLAHLLPILQLNHLGDHSLDVADDSRDVSHHDPGGHVHDDPVDELASHLSAQLTLLQVISSMLFGIVLLQVLVMPAPRFLPISPQKVPSRPLDPLSHPPKSFAL